MPHDIIDNRESFLADAVQPLLSQSARAHFAVGYFFLSGFKAIARQLPGGAARPALEPAPATDQPKATT